MAVLYTGSAVPKGYRDKTLFSRFLPLDMTFIHLRTHSSVMSWVTHAKPLNVQ